MPLLLFFLGDMVLFHVLKAGMDHYYGMDKRAEVLCVGHSHTVLGIDAERLEKELGVPVSKYATSGANTLDRLWMLRQFIEEHPSVKTVIYDVDPRIFDSDGLSSASYTLFLPYIGNPAISRYLRQEAKWQEYYVSRVLRTARFRDQTLNIALRGLLGKVENKKSSRMRVEDYSHYLAREKARTIRINPESVRCFQESIAYLTAKDVAVFLVFIPVADLLNDLDAANQEKAIAIFQDTARKNKNVHYLDYNQNLQHRHELFYDPRHLNKEGNELVTGRLIDDLRPLVGK